MGARPAVGCVSSTLAVRDIDFFFFLRIVRDIDDCIRPVLGPCQCGHHSRQPKPIGISIAPGPRRALLKVSPLVYLQTGLLLSQVWSLFPLRQKEIFITFFEEKKTPKKHEG